MKADDKVSKKVFILSIVLVVVAIIVGVAAIYMKDYVIGAAMLFVLLLQVRNIVLYKRQNG